ncbi:MAG: BNR-4 repeat-containing protein [Mangrovibacterium sp.]
MILCLGLILISFAVFGQTGSDIYGKARLLNQPDQGFRGIWYMNQPLKNNEYQYKYSGGMGTYPSNHYPFSIYVPAVNKTFFCYGGTNESNNTLFHEVSYFDHATGEVARPTIVLDKATTDAHDNPVIQVDKEGYIWLFSTSHGTGRPSFIHRSVKPYDITEFERIPATKIVNGKEVPMDNFSYLQMYYSSEHGFTGLFTHYEKVGGRGNCLDDQQRRDPLVGMERSVSSGGGTLPNQFKPGRPDRNFI